MTFAQWQGYCPLCRAATTFRSDYDWFRDHLTCVSCPGGSCPRERAIMLVLERTVPSWQNASIHESSPIGRGVSLLLRSECPGYVASQFYPGVEPGSEHAGFRCEDLERQTFADGSFDVVVTQDVMEHVFDPASAYREIHRTLKRGGVHVH